MINTISDAFDFVANPMNCYFAIFKEFFEVDGDFIGVEVFDDENKLAFFVMYNIVTDKVKFNDKIIEADNSIVLEIFQYCIQTMRDNVNQGERFIRNIENFAE